MKFFQLSREQFHLVLRDEVQLALLHTGLAVVKALPLCFCLLLAEVEDVLSLDLVLVDLQCDADQNSQFMLAEKRRIGLH